MGNHKLMVEVSRMLKDRLTSSELRNVLFGAGLNADEIGTDFTTITNFTIGVVKYYDRREWLHFDEFLASLVRLRPDLYDWAQSLNFFAIEKPPQKNTDVSMGNSTKPRRTQILGLLAQIRQEIALVESLVNEEDFS